MNKEILEITKEFHDTYEKLASEYTYETREDTKVFDINSSNGKLMYATVNEIVSPILKENKILRDNAENNDKVVDKVNWENMLLKKENEELRSILRGTTHCFDEEEHNRLKEEITNLSKDVDMWNSKYNDMFDENRMLKKQVAGKIEISENQQKEFIKYLEDEIKRINPKNLYISELNLRLDDIKFTQYLTYMEILQKYKNIIGVK